MWVRPDRAEVPGAELPAVDIRRIDRNAGPGIVRIAAWPGCRRCGWRRSRDRQIGVIVMASIRPDYLVRPRFGGALGRCRLTRTPLRVRGHTPGRDDG